MSDKIKLATKCFQIYDSDNNGILDLEEFTKLITDQAGDLGIECPTEKEIEEIFIEYDKNGDKKLSESEFLELFEVLINMKK